MRLPVLCAAALLIALTARAVPAADRQVRTFRQVIDSRQAEYVIEVGGTIDPENVEITIENLGGEPVRDPRLTVNGLYDWFDLESMAAEITRGCATAEEKALAIWEWVHWKRFQRSPQEELSANPVLAMNGYGYGICGHTAAWIKGLCTAAGLKARIWEIAGHTVSEVWYNDGWHMLDGNVKVFYLGRDNRTIASVEELQRDQWLIERTIHPRDPWVRQADPPGRNIQFVRYLITEKDNWISDGYDRAIESGFSMAMTLKPGEKLVRWWQPSLGKFEGAARDPLAPERYANGQLVWEPDLAQIDMSGYIHVRENVTTRRQSGSGPAIQCGYLQDRRLYSRPSRFSIPIECPYPMVGGRAWLRLVKGGESGELAQVGFATSRWDAGSELYTYQWGSGVQDIELVLDHRLQGESALHAWALAFAVKGNAEADPPTQSGLDGLRLAVDLQVSPHSLPALSLGKNIIRYRDSSPAGAKLAITHRWIERGDNHAPAAVGKSTSPASFSSLAPALSWEPAADPDAGDSIRDYQVLVSARPDCRWPLSPSLWRNVGGPVAAWRVPESFLNPDATYYWKVRARDAQGAVGPWSQVFSFTTAAGTR